MTRGHIRLLPIFLTEKMRRIIGLVLEILGQFGVMFTAVCVHELLNGSGAITKDDLAPMLLEALIFTLPLGLVSIGRVFSKGNFPSKRDKRNQSIAEFTIN